MEELKAKIIKEISSMKSLMHDCEAKMEGAESRDAYDLFKEIRAAHVTEISTLEWVLEQIKDNP